MKQNVSINFSQGLNTKTDQWQVPLGQFENLQNSIFQKGGLLQKRNGYGQLSSTSPNVSYITTLNDNLTAIGSTVSAFSSSLNKWITKGTLQPCSLSTLPLIRNNLNQVCADSTISNGMVLTAYTQVNATTYSYFFSIADSTTGQNIVSPTSIPVLSGGTINGSSRVFVVGNYFLIVSPVNVSGVTYLQYVSIPVSNPSNVSAAQNVTAEVYVPLGTSPGWDGVAINNSSNNTLVIAYNSTTTAQGVHVASLTSSQIASNSASTVISQFNSSSYAASIISVCVDLTVNPNLFYISFYNSGTTNGYICSVSIGFNSINQVLSPVEIISGYGVQNIASAAQNNVCTVFADISHNYGYDNSIPSNYIGTINVSSAGSVVSSFIGVRSIGLASKAFIQNGTIYFLGAYQSTYQPSYFLINGSKSTASSPVIVSKLAYENGGGYLTYGIPSVSQANGIASIAYLYKDLVEALNTLNTPQQNTAGGIYSQTGINLVNFYVQTTDIDSVEIAKNLHISGGFLAQYDGYLPVEHNFFLFPDSIECTYTASSTVTPTGTASSGSNTITVSSATGIYAGMTISDSTNSTYIPSGATVLSVSGTTVVMSANTTHAISGDTLSIQGNISAKPDGSTNTNAYYYQATYEWSDNNGLIYRSAPSIPVSVTTTGSSTNGTISINVPTLRLTSKISNPVKIVIYRWSVKNQVYQQVTSITSPVLNNTTVDYVTFVDTLPDASIVGNNIIYTTGGVVADCNGPSSTIMTLFDTRLWMVDAENPNTLWVSKQVIPNTPVEMSQQFTIFVSPTTGTVNSLGPITALFPMDDKLIIFFENGIYYINGVGPDNLGTTSVGCSLGNYSQPIYITTVAGCNNQQSIVLTQNGLMFQSDKGIYRLDRNLAMEYVGAPVEAFNGYTVNSANLIPETNYVLFTLSGTNQFLMYDYYYGQWGTFSGISAISSCIYQGYHTLIDQFGRILQENPGSFLDVDNPVLMNFTTSWINIASLQGYERFIDFYILAKYLSPHSLLCSVSYDYNSSTFNQKLITPQNFSYTTPSPFGAPTPYGSVGNVEQWRIHAKQQLCQSFQLSISEIFNPAYGTIPGAGFTMSGMTARVEIKKGTRPIRGGNSAGMS